MRVVADDLDMAEPSPLNSLVVVRVSLKPPVQITGVVVTTRPLALAARLDSPADFGPDEPLLLLTGAVGFRQVARARYSGARAGHSLPPEERVPRV